MQRRDFCLSALAASMAVAAWAQSKPIRIIVP
jgi:hypothetical protein